MVGLSLRWEKALRNSALEDVILFFVVLERTNLVDVVDMTDNAPLASNVFKPCFGEC